MQCCTSMDVETTPRRFSERARQLSWKAREAGPVRGLETMSKSLSQNSHHSHSLLPFPDSPQTTKPFNSRDNSPDSPLFSQPLFQQQQKKMKGKQGSDNEPSSRPSVSQVNLCDNNRYNVLQPAGSQESLTGASDNNRIKERSNPTVIAKTTAVQTLNTIKAEDFEGKSIDEKMDSFRILMNAVVSQLNDVVTSIHHETQGLDVRLDVCQSQADNNSDTTSRLVKTTFGDPDSRKKGLEEKVKDLSSYATALGEGMDSLQDEAKIVKGLLDTHERRIDSLSDKVVNLTARSMEKNITISGLLGDKKGEDCKKTVQAFLTDKMQLTVDNAKILVAHRIGKQGHNPRLMIVRCTLDVKKLILSNTKALKDATNASGGNFYVNRQLPEKHMENEKVIRARKKEIWAKEKHLPKDEKSKLEVRAGTLYLNEVAEVPKISPPRPSELFPGVNERRIWNRFDLTYSDSHGEKGSEFIAIATETNTIEEVRSAYAKIRSVHYSADHIACAYNVFGDTGHQDDGEYGAGRVISRELKNYEGGGITVFLVRIFGGELLGSKRFDFMQDAVQEAVNRYQS